MLRYEYDMESGAGGGKAFVFVDPSQVVTITPAACKISHLGDGWCRVRLVGTEHQILVPLTPGAFAAEVDKALKDEK